MEFSIVIPAYNESDKITSSLTQVVTFMKGFAPSFEVIVVDDGSSDNTADIVEEYAKHNPEVHVIRNPHKGKGPTVWAGVMASQGDYIYMCDADLASPIAEIKKLAVWVKDQDYDIAIASREVIGSQRIGEPFYRHFIGRGFNWGVQLVALPGIRDSQCGFKLFKRRAARDIFSRMQIYGGAAKEIDTAYLGAFDVEVLYLAKKLKYRVRSVPVTWTYVKTSRLNPILDSYRMARDVLKIRYNDIRGLYSTTKK